MEFQKPTSEYDPKTQAVTCTDMWGESETVSFAKFYARAFVVEHLHREGLYRSILSTDEALECYKRADGFGEWDASLEEYFKGGWDWSHIRDSSWSAFVEIAEYIAATKWVDGSYRAMIEKVFSWESESGISAMDFVPGK